MLRGSEAAIGVQTLNQLPLFRFLNTASLYERAQIVIGVARIGNGFISFSTRKSVCWVHLIFGHETGRLG